MQPLVTAELCNYQGFRESHCGMGRLHRVLASIPRTLRHDARVRWRTVACGSADGSDGLLEKWGSDEHLCVERLSGGEEWERTTRTNAHLLLRSLKEVRTPYFWRIENDSVFIESDFVQNGQFLWAAVQLMECMADVVAVHLRRWTPVDRADLPGGAANSARSAQVVDLCDCQGYVIEQVDRNLIWVDVTADVPIGFQPTSESGYGKCPSANIAGNVRGAVRHVRGRWYRLVFEPYATYVNHGWVGNVARLNAALAKCCAEKEDDIARAVRAYGKAGRLDKDAFIAGGWRTRLNWSSDLLAFALRWAREQPTGTMIDQGGKGSVSSHPEIVAALRPQIPVDRKTAVVNELEGSG